MSNLDACNRHPILKLSSALWLLLTLELVIGGPQGLCAFDVRFRYLIWGSAIAVSIITQVCSGLIPRWQFAGLVLLCGFVLIWVIVVPLWHGGIQQLPPSLSESKAVVGLLLIPIAARATKQFGRALLARTLAYLVALPGATVIVCWTSANIFGNSTMAEALRAWMTVSETSVSMIGPIEDGTYRIYWEIAVFFPLAIIALWRHQWFFVWSAFFVVASYCSGSRAVLAASVVATFASIKDFRRGLGLVVAVLAVVISLVVLYPTAIQQRVFSWNAEFSEGSARESQSVWLLKLFQKHFVMGAGFGAEAEGLRSDSAPWSYELTYLSLLAKTGLVGICWLTAIFLSLFRHTRGLLTLYRREWISVGLCFLLVTAFNPVLLTAFGMWLVITLVTIPPRDAG